ncbi:transcription termination factor NusA [Patescibacteria group bacterium]|nr:transcription termination factor NusA [Patescibacteria group bacterium]
MPSEFERVIKQICEEKGLTPEDVIDSISAAIAAAYRKDYGAKGQLIEAEFDPETGKSRIFEVVEVVEIEEGEEEVEKPAREISLEDAKKKDKKLEVGDTIKTEVTPDEIIFGRIAAQTAKQVITQRLREAERSIIYDTFKDKENTVVGGVVQRDEKGTVFVDLGQTTGLLFPSEQIKGEEYGIGQRIKVYVMSVEHGKKGPEIILSRAHEEIVRKLFELEVPEVASGEVELKAIAREAGSRSKIAVFSTEEDIDPVGACVGQRGSRVQTIIAELNGEKIDIIEWDEDPVKFISNALSPAKVISVQIDHEKKHAIVEVMEDQLSLAIGKNGQNVRLAVKLSGWTIDVLKAGLGQDNEDDKTKKKGKEKKSSKEVEKKEDEFKDVMKEKDGEKKDEEEVTKEKKKKKKSSAKKKTSGKKEKKKSPEKDKKEKKDEEKDE